MSFDSPPFRPIRQRSINFRGKEIATADLADGQGYVSVRSICNAFGLDPRAMRRRLVRRQNLFENFTANIVMDTPGGPQPSLCIAAPALPTFLVQAEIERIQDDEARELMKAFQDECMIVLADHFGLSERGEMQFLRESIARMSAEQEAYEEVLAKKVEAELAELRRAHEEKVQQIRAAFGDLRQQVTRLESVAGPKARLTPEQLGQLRETIATLGALLQERGVARPYPGIYMDITRLTGVSRSEDIRQADFESVIAFLDSQIHALTRGGKTSPANEQPAGDEETA